MTQEEKVKLLTDCIRAARSIEELAERLDAADVVPVVRCEDCRHRDPEDKRCEHWKSNTRAHREDNDFCSYGEKKKRP